MASSQLLGLLLKRASQHASASSLTTNLLFTSINTSQPVGSCLRQLNPTNLQHAVNHLRRPHSSFTPTKLYQSRKYSTTADYAFNSALGLNLAVLLASYTDSDEIRTFFHQNMRASVEALYDGRYHTLLTSTITHTSLIHCGVNLLVLAALRRFQPLSTREFVTLYLLGGVGGSAAHTAYWWYEAGGPKYGAEFSVNTPGFYGCSGAVAAMTAYKVVQQPLAVQVLVVLPLPVLLLEVLYVCLEVKEKDYLDGHAAKAGGAAVGVVLAALAALLRVRVPGWLQRSPK